MLKLMFLESASLNLRRYGQLQVCIQLAFAVYFLHTFLMSIFHQDLSAVVGFGICSTGVYIAGIYINGAWRWSPVLRLLGALVQLAILVAAKDAYDQTEMSQVVTICAGFVLWFIGLNIGDTLRAIRGPLHHERSAVHN